ncbi:MAG: chloride channel protein [Bdellovibrionota bacterium]
MKALTQKLLSDLSDFSVSSGRRLFHNAPYWIAALLVGVYAVFYAKIFALSEAFSKYLFKTNSVLYFFLSCAFFVSAWLLIHFVAPKARGSGIPQVMAAVEEGASSKSKYLGLRISIVKTLSSVLCVLGGGAIGREGPTLQVSASIFHFLGNKLDKYFHFRIKPEVWIIAGASAGLSAAFNTPLGGLVYAIEELSRSHLNNLKTPLISAVIVSGLAAQVLSGPYLYIGLPALASIKIGTYVYIVLTSFVCGFLGALFGKLLYVISRYIRNKKSLKISLMVPVLVAATIFLYAFYIEPNIMGSGKEVLTSLLFEERLEQHGLISLSVARFIGPILTYISGVAGGIFAPSLAAGGAFGALIADSLDVSNHNLLVMLGMISFLTGVTRTPFTAFVLVLEMTDRHSAIIPMMISALLASVVAPVVDEKSIYEKVRDDYLAKEPEIAT